MLGRGVLAWARSSSPNVVIRRSDPTTPGSGNELVTIDNEHVVTLAVVGSDLIWTTRDRGEVMKMPLAGGNATPLASGEVSPMNLACNSSWCYWAATPN